MAESSNNGEFRTLIFSYANYAYHHFIVPYIYFALRNNMDVAVEVCVDDIVEFRTVHGAALSALSRAFPARTFLVRQVKLAQRIRPNTIRFLEQPEIRAEYVYIGDIDVLILDEDLTDQHLAHMQRTGASFSNMRRARADQLTGLHFCPYDIYYPIPDITDIDVLKEVDEAVLMKLMLKKGLPIPETTFRPIHGIHASRNRQSRAPNGEAHWHARGRYLDRFEELRTEHTFLSIEPHFHKSFNNVLDQITAISRAGEKAESGVESAFTNIFDKNLWRSEKSVSGSGSSWKATALIRPGLRKLFGELRIGTLVDAPCGDANWITSIADALDIYIGVDVVPELIALNSVRNANRNMFFKLGDITKDPLPRGDAVLCRDCLVHLPFELGQKAIRRVALSGADYFISTTFPGNANKRTDRVGAWRPLDLMAEPFNLPRPIKLIHERDPKSEQSHANKSLGVWSMRQVRAALDLD